MKKTLFTIICIFSITFIFSQTPIIPLGSGTSEAPYQIATLNNLTWLSTTTSAWASGIYFIQTANIDALETNTWNPNGSGGYYGFSPIGNFSLYFGGNYNGGGYYISNLYINRPNPEGNIALFGRTYNNTIEGLGVIDINITGGSTVGGIIGENSGTVDNCYSTGVVSGYYAGGLVGTNGGSVTNCYSNVDVSGAPSATRIGGLIAHSGGTGNNVSNCYSTGTVSGSYNIGGLIGYAYNSTIINCYSTGNILGTASIGGLIGTMFGGSVNTCHSTGNIDGINFLGGLIGVASSVANITNCYCMGYVVSTNGAQSIGGFVGQINGTITNCYSSGYVEGLNLNNEVGGFVGKKYSESVVNSFWDIETSNQSASPGGGTGRTTLEMKTQSNYTDAGWDFVYEMTNGTDDIWAISSSYNNGYPNLDNESNYLWDGSEGTNWTTAANWAAESVPTTSNSVYIRSSLSNYPIITSSIGASCNDIFVESGASLTVNSGGSLITNGTITNNGTINVVRSITDGIWHLISVPNNATTANTFLGDYLQTWNESTGSWSEIINPATALTPPVTGYSLWGMTKATTYTFTGTPNTGNQSIGVTHTEVSGYDNDGTNLLGNPYPSSIDWGDLDDTWGAVYYWNGTQYATWNNGSATNGGVQYIPPMQGFFIVASTAGTFNLTNSNRTHNGATAYFKSTEEIPDNSILLEAISDNLNDELLIRFNQETSDDFELQYDAYKFLSTTEGLSQLYSFIGDEKLSIDVRPETEIIQLGFKNDIDGIYSIGIKEITYNSSTILEDTKTSTFYDLKTGSYEFAWNIADNDKRFKLHLNAVGVNENITNNEDILIYALQKTIHIKNRGTHKNTLLQITDITGKTVIERNIQLRDVTSIPTNLKSGMYIVSLRTNNSIKTEKVIIK